MAERCTKMAMVGNFLLFLVNEDRITEVWDEFKEEKHDKNVILAVINMFHVFCNMLNTVNRHAGHVILTDTPT